MIVANYIQCTLLANQTALNTGTIKIKLTDWVLHPGYYNVKVDVKNLLLHVNSKLSFLEVQ